MLKITSVLAYFRLDDGVASKRSPSAASKLLMGLGMILLTSLSSNYFFVLIMLAIVLFRLATLRKSALKRTVSVAAAAAALAFVIMLPAIFLGQSHSAIQIGTKVFISVSIAMSVALSTPFNEITSSLRAFHLPDIFILTIDLALKNIVRLGEIAIEVLTALKLRSIGKNRDKGTSIGGIGGVVFLKSQEAAQSTYAAMMCRGFEGEYVLPRGRTWRKTDLLLLIAFVVLLILFIYTEGVM